MVRVPVFAVSRFYGDGLLRECVAIGALQGELSPDLKLKCHLVRDLPTLVRKARRSARSEAALALLPLARHAPPDQIEEAFEALQALGLRRPALSAVLVLWGEGPVPVALPGRLRRAGAAEVVIAGEEDPSGALARRLHALLLESEPDHARATPHPEEHSGAQRLRTDDPEKPREPAAPSSSPAPGAEQEPDAAAGPALEAQREAAAALSSGIRPSGQPSASWGPGLPRRASHGGWPAMRSCADLSRRVQARSWPAC